MDFLERLIEYVEGLSFMPSNIKIGLFDENGNSVAIRPTPSTINERYVEKSKIYPYSFQVLVHNKSNVFAYEVSQKLLGVLDTLDKELIQSSNNSFELLSIRCTTTPNFVQKTGYGYLWTMMFEAELFVKG